MKDFSVFYPTNHCDAHREYCEELKVLSDKYTFDNLPRRDYGSKYEEIGDLIRKADYLMAWLGGGVEKRFGTKNSTVELLFDMTEEDFALIKERGVKIVGLSDVTYLLAALQNRGIKCYHGPNLVSKFINCDGDSERLLMFESLENALNNDECTIDLGDKAFNVTENPTVVNGGKAKGRIVGGNAETLCAILRMYPEYMLKRKAGDIIFIESVHPSYDENGTAIQLKTLSNNGFFESASAVIIGKGKTPLIKRGEERDWKNREWEYEHLVESVKKFIPKNIPVIINAPSGHVSPMMTIPLGSEAELDADNLKLKILK